MAFRFPLAAVLKYREDLEKREERELEKRREALARLKTALTNTTNSRFQLILERASLLKQGLLGDDLHFAAEQLRQIERLEEDLRTQVGTAAAHYEEQMKVFLEARKKRTILDELKSAQASSYKVNQERREQQQIDEMFSARLNRNK